MFLPAGTRLGPYEILAPLGAGGMGEVYRARDTRLGRDVAIKVLPELFANDPDRLARFERESRAIAALSHPNIRAILDVARDASTGSGQAGAAYAVMELLEGETLRDRIASGALPPRDAITLAVQIADGLAAAHDSGIAHRDLKPENLFITRDGRMKILDFGLAKLLDPGASDETGRDGTAAGSVMGTVGYMAPEQLRGYDVDHRADIFAFGAVLHEMLSGRRAFAGDSAADTISATLTTDPPEIDAHVSGVAPLLDRIVKRCLEKRPEARFQSAHDLAFALEASGGERQRAVEPAAGGWRHAARWAVPVVVLAIAGIIVWRGVNRTTPVPLYATIAAPAGAVLGDDDPLAPLPTRTPMVFTPDGRSLIMLASHLGKRQLFVRSLDRPDARPIAGTEGARVPFVSPDGTWVGFWMGGALRKVPLAGGEAVTLCALPSRFGPTGASWGDGDTIVFGDARSGRLMRVSGIGGVPVPVTAEVTPGSQRGHVTPFVLPGGKHVLFADVSWRDAPDAQLMVQPLDGGEARLVMPSATDGRVLPSGQLAFMRLGTLMTVPFDLGRFETRGTPVAALSGVMQSGLLGVHGAEHTGAGMFAVSSEGALAAVRGPVTGPPDALLEWETRTGQSSSADPASGAPAGGRMTPRISPDQSRALVSVLTPLREELWIADWRRDVWVPCAGCDSTLAYAEWSPDGGRVLVTRGDALVAHTLDVATGERVVVREPGRTLFPSAWLPDGRIVYMSSPDSRKFEIKVLEPGGSAGRVVVPLGIGDAPAVSPGARWLAYDTNPSGVQKNVIVEAFPGGGSRTQISAGGGSNPSWSADGRALYYVVNDGDFVAVTVTTGSVFTAGTPRELFGRDGSGPCIPARCYDVAQDSRFLMDGPPKAARVPATTMDLVLNWTATLGTRAVEARR